ncbi:YvcK family protein [Candidatus Giovannonibacteria bacterium]|nr:YvcK family protein [Candidatus Giovannonibacteria bacterium]
MSKRKRIVVIGGGSGIFNILKGLKNYPLDISAVVTMFDSGGSSGILRDEFGIWPAGDLRRCLGALADDKYERFFNDLLELRFKKTSSLGGHKFGNIFLLALANTVGNDALAIKKAEEILRVKGRVLPVSLDRSHLSARLENGQIIEGETNIDVPKHDGSLRIDQVFLNPCARIHDETELAIMEADLIVLGPGDMYTSIIPNLLVEGMPRALQKSNAKKILVMNLTTKWGETNGFTASHFAGEALYYSGLEEFDYIICNNNTERLEREFIGEKNQPVSVDAQLRHYTKKIIAANLLSEKFVRHDPQKMGEILDNIATSPRALASQPSHFLHVKAPNLAPDPRF